MAKRNKNILLELDKMISELRPFSQSVAHENAEARKITLTATLDGINVTPFLYHRHSNIHGHAKTALCLGRV